MNTEQEERFICAIEKLAGCIERIAALHGECAAPTSPGTPEEAGVKLPQFDDAPQEEVKSQASVKAKGSGIRYA